jgi:hypothetical protein
MKFFQGFFILFFILITINNCDNPVKSDNFDSTFPLAIGNQWHYDRTLTTFNIRPYSNITIDSTTLSISIDVEITGTESLENINKAFVLLEKTEEEFRTYYSTSYYANSDSGLFLYAYKGGGTVLPKLPQNYSIRFKDIYFEQLSQIVPYFNDTILPKAQLSDSIIYERFPVKVLQYPLSIGSQWLFGDIEIVTIYKKAISKEIVEVPAGKFDCYKIQYLYEPNEDYKWTNITSYDYVNQNGLIKRSVLIKDVEILNEQGQQIGLIDFKDEYLLTAYSLK